MQCAGENNLASLRKRKEAGSKHSRSDWRWWEMWGCGQADSCNTCWPSGLCVSMKTWQSNNKPHIHTKHVQNKAGKLFIFMLLSLSCCSFPPPLLHPFLFKCQSAQGLSSAAVFLTRMLNIDVFLVKPVLDALGSTTRVSHQKGKFLLWQRASF